MAIILERVSTAVPWPRGICCHDGNVAVLSRGIHRKQGGPNPDIEDMAGTLFRINPSISEPPDSQVSQAVLRNSSILALPADPPFKLWDRHATPAHTDLRTDRPYATLKWDAATESYYICGFSGLDLPPDIKDWPFWKNGSDGIHRFDTRTNLWRGVESHRWDIIPKDEIRDPNTSTAPDHYYPHDSILHNADCPPPHGWLNGPDALEICGNYLYALGLDNQVLAQYDLTEVANNPHLEYPPSRKIIGADSVGYSAITCFANYLYTARRQSARAYRMPVDNTGQLLATDGTPYLDPDTQELEKELVARFDDGNHLIDIAFNSRGEMFASIAGNGRIWNVGVPDPSNVFRASEHEPWLDLRATTPNDKAKCADIAFDESDRLYICSGNKDTNSNAHNGTIYRAYETTDGKIGLA